MTTPDMQIIALEYHWKLWVPDVVDRMSDQHESPHTSEDDEGEVWDDETGPVDDAESLVAGKRHLPSLNKL